MDYTSLGVCLFDVPHFLAIRGKYFSVDEHCYNSEFTTLLIKPAEVYNEKN